LGCPVDGRDRPRINQATQQLGPSARACYRVLKLARTTADLAGADNLEPARRAEAIQEYWGRRV
jgi:magnesium chelatase family protein